MGKGVQEMRGSFSNSEMRIGGIVEQFQMLQFHSISGIFSHNLAASG